MTLPFAVIRDRISAKGGGWGWAKFIRKTEVSSALKFRGEKRQTSLCELLHKV